MSIFSVRTYTPNDFNLWNIFVSQAKNATFLFHRDFMDYHKERFQDFSLMVFDKQRLVALLPAHAHNRTLYSHQGLTYGGIIIDNQLKLHSFLELFESICNFLSPLFDKVIFKELPRIYPKYPADELLYALFLKDARLTRRDTLAVIDYQSGYEISPKRHYEIRKSGKYELTIRETTDFENFWNTLLIPNLQEKHQAQPVHSLSEITKLHRSFPKNIKQFGVWHQDHIIAGAIVFETEQVAHIQYIASIKSYSFMRGIDFLFDYLIRKYEAEKRYFDFGISNENHGKTLNEGLLYWKESFGAKIITQDFYELDLTQK